jgi:uncharacterized cupin superfamily protein
MSDAAAAVRLGGYHASITAAFDFFPRGRRGGHTPANRSDAPARYLMVSNKVMPELVEYPEEGTIRALTRGRFDPPIAGEDRADRLNLQFKRSAAEEQ